MALLRREPSIILILRPAPGAIVLRELFCISGRFCRAAVALRFRDLIRHQILKKRRSNMFNRKSFYALNKKDPNAIVYTDADGNLIRLTRDDFSNEEEFLRWKKISDMDYHGEEKVDHLYYDGTLPLESLAEEVIAVPSAEEGYITEIDLSERHLLENLLLEGMGTKLTERQRTRLWLYCINGVTAAEIASFEGIAQQNVSKSIASAKKKLKKFLKNRV